jgi:hypothetical protein
MHFPQILIFEIMNRPVSVNDFSVHLFWDLDVTLFDFEKHKAHLIQKVLQ